MALDVKASMQKHRDQKTKKQKNQLGKDNGLLEKIAWAALPICVSCIGYLMTELSSMRNQLTVLENKVAVVVNSENKAIPPQGTTIEMEAIRAAAAEARSEMKMEISKNMNEIKENAMLERAEIKQRVAVLEYKNRLR